jgi:hypothetical protein
MNHDEEMRALLEHAVADVEPRHGLDAIRSRTAGGRRRTWSWGVGGAALATAATIVAVVALSGRAGAPTPGPTPATGSASPGPVVTVYFVGDTGAGHRLFPEQHRTESAEAALDEAMGDAYGGVASDLDHGSLWPAGSRIRRAELGKGVLSVDLHGPVADRPPGMTRADASLSLQQLVFTAQSVVGKALPVTFLLDGRPTATVLGEPTDAPVPAASPYDVLSPVIVDTPTEGATVSSPFKVEGKAAAFEANVPWELLRGGTVVRRGFATAAECCTLSTYSFTVQAPPGAYTLVVHDEDPSGGEGNPPTQDTKQVLVR